MLSAMRRHIGTPEMSAQAFSLAAVTGGSRNVAGGSPVSGSRLPLSAGVPVALGLFHWRSA